MLQSSGLPSQQDMYPPPNNLPPHVLSELDQVSSGLMVPQLHPSDVTAPHPALGRIQTHGKTADWSVSCYSLSSSLVPSPHGLEDPPGLSEKVELLLSEWVRSYHHPMMVKDMDQIYIVFVNKLQQQGIMKNDDLITRFFRISVEMCVGLCYK